MEMSSDASSSAWRRARRRKNSEHIRLELTNDEETEAPGMKKCIGVKDLIAYGIACTVGAGIFVTSGTAAKNFSGSEAFS